MKQAGGFTLVELLIATSILMILLGALTGLFVNTTRAYQVNERVSADQQNVEAALQLLKYELGLAGYRGTDIDPLNPNNPDTNYDKRRFGNQSTLALTLGGGAAPDSIRIRYFEDRYVSPPQLREVIFSIDTDTQGVKNLYRQEASSNEPAVAGVINLKVLNYRLQSGAQTTTMPASVATIAGMTLRLTFASGATKDLGIALPNVQCASPTPPCTN